MKTAVTVIRVRLNLKIRGSSDADELVIVSIYWEHTHVPQLPMARQANSLSGLTSDQVCPTNLVINIHCWEVNISVFVDIFLHIWPLYNCSILILNDAFTDTLSGCT